MIFTTRDFVACKHDKSVTAKTHDHSLVKLEVIAGNDQIGAEAEVQISFGVYEYSPVYTTESIEFIRVHMKDVILFTPKNNQFGSSKMALPF